MGIILIIIGIAIWFLWANAYNNAQQNPMLGRMASGDESKGCIIPVIAFVLVAIGIYLVAQ